MQADFFGKRGISWHLTVCQSKQQGELVAQTSVHIVESGLQDNHIVVTVIEHVLMTLKQEHSEVNQSCLPPRERRVPSLHKYHSSQQNIA